MRNFIKHDLCRLCQSRNLELIMNIGSTPVGDDFIPENRLDKIQQEYPLELYFCQDCCLLQVPGVINQELVYGEYLYETSSSLGLKAHFKHYADKVLRCVNPPKDSLVIDIGSNDGTLLKYFQGKGMRVLGIEPSLEIAKRVTASGVETLPNFFNKALAREIKKSHGSATVVTANNVFANVDDLNDFIDGIKEVLTLDSVFIFETGYMIDLVQNMVFDNIYHEHLCYFSIKPLVKFFGNHGLELIDVERVATKGGSIRCTVQLEGASRSVSPSVAELMTLETELGFDSLTPLKIFVNKIGSLRDQLKRVLSALKAQGKTIAGYGASVGVTTLLYYFDLKDCLSFLVDDNPTRHHLYSPGHHLQVLSPLAIYERKPDYVLILAWRYAHPIMKKHLNYLKQGGCFLKFLPTVEVISSMSQERRTPLSLAGDRKVFS